MSGGGGASDANKKCGLLELIVFIAAIVAGTACSILSKTMMGLQAEGITGEVETFEKPIFQTFGMFLGMTFGLVMHFVVLACKIPFPGYDHDNNPTQSSSSNTKKFDVDSGAAVSEKTGLLKKVDESKSSSDIDDLAGESTQIPTWMYFFLAIPAVFDLGATALCMMGLRVRSFLLSFLLLGNGSFFITTSYIQSHPLLYFPLFHYRLSCMCICNDVCAVREYQHLPIVTRVRYYLCSNNETEYPG